MASTYEKIATTTLGSSATTVTFSSISGAFTDLVAVITAKANTSADVYVRCNSDSGTNYSYTGLSGSGSAASSFRVSNTSNGMLLDNLGYADNNNNQIIIAQFNNYSNTTTYKTSIARSNNAATGVDALVGLWRSTSAINELTFRLNSTHSYQVGTVITLYGIKAA
jgi:hypothetical protein